MKAPLVSLLIPIYNVEPYLDQALSSAVSQTLKDLEIICINDGSTDNSLNIIKSYAKKDPRIIIIDKPNSGYGDSMNQGLKKAQGKYIGILEPDDWLESNALATLYTLAKEHEADVARGNYYESTTSSETDRPLDKKTTLISNHDANLPLAPAWFDNPSHPKLYEKLFRLPPAIWSAIYRRDFLLENNISFLPTPGASYQDLGFNFKVLATAQRIVLTDEAFLHYRTDNANSSVHNPGKALCVVEEYAGIADFLEERNLLKSLAPLMSAAKFRNYHWNLQRLDHSLAKDFYRTMRSELRLAAQNHWLKKSNFTKFEWLALQGVLHAPIFTKNLLNFRRRLRHPK